MATYIDNEKEVHLKRRIVGFLFLLISLGFFAPNLKSQEGTAVKQPVAPVRPVTDDYYGTKIVDNYRYMENLKDPEVQAWMKAQNAYTRAVLAEIPGRERLLEQIRKFDQTVPQVAATRLPGDLYVIKKLLPSENVSKLYLRHGLTGNDKLILDPEKIVLAPADRGKGKNVITFAVPSLDMKYLAVTVVPGGSEGNTELHVIETATGRETGDVIPDTELWSGQEPVGGLPAWLPGNRSFVYGRDKDVPGVVPAPYRVYLHVLGTNPQNDPAVFGYGAVPSITLGPGYRANIVVQPNSTYALGMRANGIATNSAFYIEPVADLGKTNSVWRKIADLSDDVKEIAVHGDDVYVLTHKDAPRYKLLRTNAQRPDLALAETVVAPGEAVIEGIHPAEDAIYVRLLDGGIGCLLRVAYGSHPRVEQVALPFEGTITVQSDPRIPGVLVTMESWTTARKIYAYDPRTKRVTDTGLRPVGPYDSPGNIESVEVKVRSYDGTIVPLSIVYPKSIKLDGSNPTLLSGYGAYGISRRAAFLPPLLAWYDQGGVYAVCHVRGGGEYGEAWHLAGKGATKPNTWRDFIACAQYLIEHKYTTPARLAGTGTSAGGILIGRAITSRPELFAAAIDQVGLSDTLRFETTGSGVVNMPEFGSVKTEAGFKSLYAMSPYAHIKNGTPYPAVLLMTGANDPRVDPWQMDKMTARLQAATTSGKPVLLRVSYHGGHGLMGGTEAQFQETNADQLSFLLWQLGDPGFQPPKR